MEEIWKDIDGYEGLYQVSNLGRIKSLSREVNHHWGDTLTLKEKILNPSLSKSTGYYRVNLRKNGKTKTVYIHIIVANNFIQKDYQLLGLHCNHIDGIKSNNKLSNLEVITKSENELHAFRIGLKSHKGEKHNLSKLTQIQVNEIRSKYEFKVTTFKMLAKEYNVSIPCIQHIIQERSWHES